MDWDKVKEITSMLSFLGNNDAKTALAGIVKARGRLTAKEIYACIGMEQSSFSHQCIRLQRYGIIYEVRQGKNKFFKVNRFRIKLINHIIKHEI